jgi:tetratricopeptide (TPR) repeat protein
MAMGEGTDTPSVMLRYNVARVEFAKGNLNKASKNILHCILLRPTFSEFWCLLGDMFYRRMEYGKARDMYENALALGKRRKGSDDGPIDIAKYDKYPREMSEKMSILRRESQMGNINIEAR